MTFPASNAIQNGAPDGLKIRDRFSGAVLDAVEYESPSGPVCLSPATPVGDPSSEPTFSIQLCPSTGWVSGVASPCAANVECPVVGVDPSSWGMIKSQF